MRETLRKLLFDALLECTPKGFSDDPEEQPRVEACADENEYASRVTEVGVQLALRRRQALRRGEIEDALERLDSGCYGICEECGGKISRARLLANPTTRLCIRCQSESERMLPRCA